MRVLGRSTPPCRRPLASNSAAPRDLGINEHNAYEIGRRAKTVQEADGNHQQRSPPEQTSREKRRDRERKKRSESDSDLSTIQPNRGSLSRVQPPVPGSKSASSGTGPIRNLTRNSSCCASRSASQARRSNFLLPCFRRLAWPSSLVGAAHSGTVTQLIRQSENGWTEHPPGEVYARPRRDHRAHLRSSGSGCPQVGRRGWRSTYCRTAPEAPLR